MLKLNSINFSLEKEQKFQQIKSQIHKVQLPFSNNRPPSRQLNNPLLETPSSISHRKCIALFDYYSLQKDQLTYRQNDVMNIVKSDNFVYTCELNGMYANLGFYIVVNY